MTMAESAAQNSILTLIARAAMIVSLPVAVWIAGYVQGLGTEVTTLKIQVGAIQARIEAGQRNRDAQYNEITDQLKLLDSRTIAILEKVARIDNQ